MATVNKSGAEEREGDRFEGALNRILRVPKEELAKREAAYQKSRKAARNRTAKSRVK